MPHAGRYMSARPLAVNARETDLHRVKGELAPTEGPATRVGGDSVSQPIKPQLEPQPQQQPKPSAVVVCS